MIHRILNRLRTLKHTYTSANRLYSINPHSLIIEKYHYFQELLHYNNDILKLTGELEDKLPGNDPFGIDFIKSAADKINLCTFQMIKSLNHVAGNRYMPLYGVLDRVNGRIQQALKIDHAPSTQKFVIPYHEITRDMLDDVGGKNANLGEIRNRKGLPVPDGFAITTHAYDIFMKNNELYEKIHKKLSILDLADQDTIDTISKEIQSMILKADVPDSLLNAINSAYDKLARSAERDVRVAVRSSNVNEDGALSFAGQYTTVLNVSKEYVLPAYKQIIASLYSPPAIVYRAHKGLIDTDQRMGVGCMIMIDADTAGIIYTKDPNNPGNNTVIINAVRGLGKPAVDGTVTPDVYIVDRITLKVLEKHSAEKYSMLVAAPLNGVDTVAVDEKEKNKPCLSDDRVGIIAEKALQIENYYTSPQDIEWCTDKSDQFFILQTRPLRFSPGIAGSRKKYNEYPVLVDGGSVICPGIGMGKAFVIKDEKDINNVPAGAVLLAPHSSPALVRVMDRINAIITDTGGVAGHMASMAREFNIPSITDTKSATSVIKTNDEITVDADSAYVYRGIVKQLVKKEQSNRAFMKDTPVHKLLQKVSQHITPLHLTDPMDSKFEPEFCDTIHDITRYCHEKAIASMFSICDGISDAVPAIKVGIRLPVDLYVLDIGGGIEGELHKGKIKMHNIASAPFYAFMKGMTHKDIRWWEPRRFDLKGFFSVISSSTTRIVEHEKPIGERTYAAVSKYYFNFNSRVGYHFSTVDAYCDDVKSNNYITFYFQGGASEDIRRLRRAKFLTNVLNSLGFVTETTGDRITAHMRKYGRKVIEEKLDLLGRLTLCALHLDMLMTTDASVEWFTKAFLEGNYNFEFNPKNAFAK